MVFDAHSDLLYDVTRRRLLGERRVLEHHHLDRLRRGGVEGLGAGRLGQRSPGDVLEGHRLEGSCIQFGPHPSDICLVPRADLAECPQIRPVHTAAEAEAAGQRAKSTPSWRWRAWRPSAGTPPGVDWYYGQGARLGMLTWNETNALARPEPEAILRRG